MRASSPAHHAGKEVLGPQRSRLSGRPPQTGSYQARCCPLLHLMSRVQGTLGSGAVHHLGGSVTGSPKSFLRHQNPTHHHGPGMAWPPLRGCLVGTRCSALVWLEDRGPGAVLGHLPAQPRTGGGAEPGARCPLGGAVTRQHHRASPPQAGEAPPLHPRFLLTQPHNKVLQGRSPGGVGDGPRPSPAQSPWQPVFRQR